MPAIPETYASPNLRVGLVLEDHPHATYTFEKVRGNDPRIALPEGYGNDRHYCLCILNFNNGTPEHYGYKPCAESGSADEWNVLCTKALGRALKRAGYPDDTKDLKALVLWRQRQAEIRGIDSGKQQLAIESADSRERAGDPAMRALDAAATAPPPEVPDDASAEEVAEARAQMLELVAGLDPIDLDAFVHFAATTCGIEDYRSDSLSGGEIDRLLGWFDAAVVDAPGD